MKMGLGLVLVGHVNFLLGALVHGAVLRHINVHSQARVMVYAISNVLAIVAGLLVSGLVGPIWKSMLVFLLFDGSCILIPMKRIFVSMYENP